MFTGIVEAVGQVTQLEIKDVGAILALSPAKLPIADIRPGDSIAVSGVCLTVTSLADQCLYFDLSVETLARTILGGLMPGSYVNLEKALLANGRLGGHLVTGHIDGKGQVVNIESRGESISMRLAVEHDLTKYLAEKGSICVDGVSLTVSSVDDKEFTLHLIPHTLAETTLKNLQVGDYVNIEVDIVARYLERLLAARAAPTQIGAGINEQFLHYHGFIKN